MPVYYRANKETAKQIRECLKDEERFRKEVESFAREVGARRSMFYFNSVGARTLYGLSFKNPPDPKLWSRLKNTSDGWRPKRRKGSELAARFYKLGSDAVNKIAEVIGYSFNDRFNNMSFWSPGVYVGKDDNIYVVVVDKAKKPKGCVRVSDIQFEKQCKQ